MDSVAVLNIRSSRFIGGPEKQILGFAQKVRRHGIVPSVACWELANGKPALVSAARSAGLDTVVLPFRRRLDPRAFGDVLRVVRQSGADVVAGHDYKAVLLALPACRLLGIPIVGHARGWTAHTARVRVYEAAERAALRALDLVVAVSEAKRSELLRLGMPGSKVITVYNSVDTAQYVSADGRRMQARKVFGLEDGAQVIGSVGRLSQEKGHAVLIEALVLLRDAGCAPKLLVIGDGPEEVHLKDAVRRLGLEAQVIFAGFREGADRLIAGLDLLVLPSLSEGLPNVVLEAYANRVPVVASRVGGVPEVVEHPRTGLLVPPRDPCALAEAVRAVLGDRQTAVRMAEAGFELVSRRFSFAANAPKLAEAYRSVACRGRRR